MYYLYRNTIITVRPGLGRTNWAACKRKPSGGWTTVKAPAMPRTEHFEEAVNNLHAWAKSKHLEKADCGCCFYAAADGRCEAYGAPLERIDDDTYGEVFLRCALCLSRGVMTPERRAARS